MKFQINILDKLIPLFRLQGPLIGPTASAVKVLYMIFLILEMEGPVLHQGWIYFVNKKHQSFVMQVEISCTSNLDNTGTRKNLHFLLYHLQQVCGIHFNLIA